MVILPPDDGEDTEEDSGDEEVGGSHNNLSGRQLAAPAQAQISTFGSDEIELLGAPEEDEEELRELGQPSVTTLPKTLEWQKIDIEASLGAFVGTTGPAIPESSVSCFELFFDDAVIEHLCKNTNLYAHQKGDHAFVVTQKDIRCFLGILFLSGYMTVPRWRLWWEVGSECYCPMVAEAMRRNRFDTIKKYLHCADNTRLNPGDKFAKVSPLISLINERFLKLSEVQQNISVDESMVPYYGRHGAKQFIRGKPIRFGYKMWCVCQTNGYLLQFYPYGGKDVTRPRNVGLGEHVVEQLVGKLPPAPYRIFADRFFSTFSLALKMKSLGMGYTGTIMANRICKCPLPNKRAVEKTARGSFDYRKEKTTECLFIVWNDNRAVYLISTCDQVFPTVEAKRWSQTEKKKVAIPQPNCVQAYNKNMGGVDRMDQNVSTYRIGIRSKKWWWPLFAYCLDVTMANAWQLHKKKYRLDSLAFRRCVVQTYLKKYATQTSTGRPKTSKSLASRTVDEVRHDLTDHWLIPADKQNRCAQCKKNTTKCCKKCGINLHEKCFVAFHKM